MTKFAMIKNGNILLDGNKPISLDDFYFLTGKHPQLMACFEGELVQLIRKDGHLKIKSKKIIPSVIYKYKNKKMKLVIQSDEGSMLMEFNHNKSNLTFIPNGEYIEVLQ